MLSLGVGPGDLFLGGHNGRFNKTLQLVRAALELQPRSPPHPPVADVPGDNEVTRELDLGNTLNGGVGLLVGLT